MRRFIFLLAILLSAMELPAQQPFRIIFWNTENLFFPGETEGKKDLEFRPESPRHWTYGRFRDKTINMAKSIIDISNGSVPAIIGLCEVENDSCMEYLLNRTPLNKANLKYFITDSPDPRGINVALAYDRYQFKPFNVSEFSVEMPSDMLPTRNILLVSGVVPSNDTLDVLVTHFPSKRGGEINSRPGRIAASKQLKQIADSISNVRSKPLIVVMGDMNDEPLTSVQKMYLGALPINPDPDKDRLYNLSSFYQGEGTYKYRHEWLNYDQFLVSGLVLDDMVYPKITKCDIYESDDLLMRDTNYGGNRPKRTYYGFKYENGISDHLPVVLELKLD